ncbi:MAG TPA: invasion associated locus B family protein [Patescibacteria group bacterium]|nr:invasion associated locus B family protein [Patescibacteria group bacterium]
MKKTLLTTAVVFISAATAFAQGAQDAKPLGKFGNWEAAWFTDNGNKVCYMASKPQSTSSDKPVKGREDSFLFITHWPAEDEKNAVTVDAGFTIKPGSRATVSVDGKVFTMATGGRDKPSESEAQMAWMDDQGKEDELAAAIAKGTALTIRNASKRGNMITDTYSLQGAGEAYKAINKECGY